MKEYPISFILIHQNIATTAIKDEYHIIRNRYCTICGPTAQRLSYNRCVPCKGNLKQFSSKTFRSKKIYNDAWNTHGPQGKRWVEEQ